MSNKLDWKWIGIGVLIMLGLNIVAGIIVAIIIAPDVQGAADVSELSFSAGQMALFSVLNFLAFALGGFIVGLKSAGRTILEPGISAAAAVAIALAIAGSFSVPAVIAGGLVPFLAGVLGGWLGERRQAAAPG